MGGMPTLPGDVTPSGMRQCFHSNASDGCHREREQIHRILISGNGKWDIAARRPGGRETRTECIAPPIRPRTQ